MARGLTSPARAALALALLLAGGAASAQTAFDAGLAAFQAHNYTTALRQFQRSYARSHRPELLFNIALTYERLGRVDEAVATFQQFVALQPTSPQRADAERRIAVLRPVVLPPPPPVVVVARPVVAAPVVVVRRPLVVAPPTRVASRPVWPWIVLATGVAAGVTGAALLGTVGDPGGDSTVLREAQYVTAVDGAHAQGVAGVVLLGVGGAAAIAGVIGLVAGRPSGERAAVQPYAAPVAGGGVVGVTLRAL